MTEMNDYVFLEDLAKKTMEAVNVAANSTENITRRDFWIEIVKRQCANQLATSGYAIAMADEALAAYDERRKDGRL